MKLKKVSCFKIIIFIVFFSFHFTTFGNDMEKIDFIEFLTPEKYKEVVDIEDWYISLNSKYCWIPLFSSILLFLFKRKLKKTIPIVKYGFERDYIFESNKKNDYYVLDIHSDEFYAMSDQEKVEMCSKDGFSKEEYKEFIQNSDLKKIKYILEKKNNNHFALLNNNHFALLNEEYRYFQNSELKWGWNFGLKILIKKKYKNSNLIKEFLSKHKNKINYLFCLDKDIAAWEGRSCHLCSVKNPYYYGDYGNIKYKKEKFNFKELCEMRGKNESVMIID